MICEKLKTVSYVIACRIVGRVLLKLTFLRQFYFPLWPLYRVTANIILLQSSLYSESPEGFIKHSGGVNVTSLIQKVKHAGKEGELEDHLDNGIEGVGSKAHVVHETIPVPALTIQDVINDLLPKVPEGPKDRENAHVPHNAVEKRVVEEAHHKPYKAHWREELNLR